MHIREDEVPIAKYFRDNFLLISMLTLLSLKNLIDYYEFKKFFPIMLDEADFMRLNVSKLVLLFCPALI